LLIFSTSLVPLTSLTNAGMDAIMMLLPAVLLLLLLLMRM
jgi:hypothetical protein